MTLIRRIGGGPGDEWYFDGRNLVLCCPSRASVTYDGVLLQDCEYLGGRGWVFDGVALALLGAESVPWKISGGFLVRGDNVWAFTTKSLASARDAGARWESNQDVPLPVLARVAGLLTPLV